MQLTAPGKVVIRIQERGALPSLICARVVDPEDGNLLIFEVKQRIPEELTHEDIERFIETWSKAGWIEKVNISK